jgi:hypothetical protein
MPEPDPSGGVLPPLVPAVSPPAPGSEVVEDDHTARPEERRQQVGGVGLPLGSAIGEDEDVGSGRQALRPVAADHIDLLDGAEEIGGGARPDRVGLHRDQPGVRTHPAGDPGRADSVGGAQLGDVPDQDRPGHRAQEPADFGEAGVRVPPAPGQGDRRPYQRRVVTIGLVGVETGLPGHRPGPNWNARGLNRRSSSTAPPRCRPGRWPGEPCPTADPSAGWRSPCSRDGRLPPPAVRV